jgi:hypothetical protein
MSPCRIAPKQVILKKFCQACNNFLSENSPLFKTGAPWAEEVLWPERFAALLS